MLMLYRLCTAGLALSLTVLAGGCGQGFVQNEDVAGTVTLDGKPLVMVSVQFWPDFGPDVKVPAASAMSDDKGNYRLKCENGKPGAIVGKHRVVIVQGRTFVQPDEQVTPEEAAALKLARANGIVPTRYTVAMSTPLQFDVTADKHKYDVELQSDPAP